MRYSVLSMLFVFTVLTHNASAGGVLWYNGDVNITSTGLGGGGTVNEVATNLGAINIYDDFVITDPLGWTIDKVWSNNSMRITGVTQASWSIRSGMSAGNGGTIVAGGTASATQTATGRINPSLGFAEYSIAVSGLSVYLAPGTYWLSVSPLVGSDAINSGYFASYNSTTALKANAVGLPGTSNANSFLNSPYLGYNFASAFANDYSMGVAGIVGTAAVPEPASLAMWGIGAIGMMVARRKRQQKNLAA